MAVRESTGRDAADDVHPHAAARKLHDSVHDSGRQAPQGLADRIRHHAGQVLRRSWRLLLLLAVLSGPGTGTTAAATGRGTILVYGDSLSAAYGIAQKDGWVSLLADRLRASGSAWTVANASISGETSSGGASRIAAALSQHQPRITILALGANDGLRGLPVSQMQANLSAIIRAARAAGSKVVLVGMQMPPNYGPAYTRDFSASFGALARQFQLPLVPFLLQGVAERPELFQPDQLHPVAAAQPRILDNVWAALKPLL